MLREPKLMAADDSKSVSARNTALKRPCSGLRRCVPTSSRNRFTRRLMMRITGSWTKSRFI